MALIPVSPSNRRQFRFDSLSVTAICVYWSVSGRDWSGLRSVSGRDWSGLRSVSGRGYGRCLAGVTVGVRSGLVGVTVRSVSGRDWSGLRPLSVSGRDWSGLRSVSGRDWSGVTVVVGVGSGLVGVTVGVGSGLVGLRSGRDWSGLRSVSGRGYVVVGVGSGLVGVTVRSGLVGVTVVVVVGSGLVGVTVGVGSGLVGADLYTAPVRLRAPLRGGQPRSDAPCGPTDSCIDREQQLPPDDPVWCNPEEGASPTLSALCCDDTNFCNARLTPTLAPPLPTSVGGPPGESGAVLRRRAVSGVPCCCGPPPAPAPPPPLTPPSPSNPLRASGRPATLAPPVADRAGCDACRAARCLPLHQLTPPENPIVCHSSSSNNRTYASACCEGDLCNQQLSPQLYVLARAGEGAAAAAVDAEADVGVDGAAAAKQKL